MVSAIPQTLIDVASLRRFRPTLGPEQPAQQASRRAGGSPHAGPAPRVAGHRAPDAPGSGPDHCPGGRAFRHLTGLPLAVDPLRGQCLAGVDILSRDCRADGPEVLVRVQDRTLRRARRDDELANLRKLEAAGITIEEIIDTSGTKMITRRMPGGDTALWACWPRGVPYRRTIMQFTVAHADDHRHRTDGITAGAILYRLSDACG